MVIIKKIGILWVLLAVTVIYSNFLGNDDAISKVRQPNILLIVADDLGYGDVGFNGQDKIKTPAIDQLAKEGMIFTRMYAGSTVCGPSRASLMTGLHTGHGTVRGNPKWTLSGRPVDIDSTEETVAEVLKNAGYRTGIIGKWGLAENLAGSQPNQRGFDYFYGFNKHLPAHHYYPEQIWENDSLLSIPNDTQNKKGKHVQELFTERAIDFIDQSTDQPFFLYLAYTTPHFELTIPEEYKKQYRDQDWPLRKMNSGHYLHDEDGHVTYAAMVSKMDADIGRIMKLLKEKGVDDNTLVIFTSDNGHEYDQVDNEFFNSNANFRGRKRDLYDGGIHMPFVARWPEQIEANSSSDHLAAFWDMKATLSDLAGGESDESGDGISFSSTLLGKNKQAKHDYLYWEFNESNGPMQALLKENWKLVYKVELKKYELYNLEEGKSEARNVVMQNPQKTKMMKLLMADARTEHPEFPLTRRPNPYKK
ncbi:MAG: arylsulfatase [Reichenbachiella sp.]